MATHHGHFNFGIENPPRSTYHDQGKFGRLFPNLPPFAEDTRAVREALLDIGKSGGIMDAKDDLRDPVKLITDPEKFKNNPDNPNITAGFTFLGQFIDHDITFDPTSSLERQQDPEAIANFRTPLLELDNVYGSGPTASPHLYDQESEEVKFYVEEIPGSETETRNGKKKFDLPRNGQLTALIADPRNDENLIVSHSSSPSSGSTTPLLTTSRPRCLRLRTVRERFLEAQRLVRWHYQWIILHEFLPKTCGQDKVDDVLQQGRKGERKFFNWRNGPFIPTEFSVGAYRFGHSQVRPSYRANFGKDDNHQFFGLIFNDKLPRSDDPDDLRGSKRAKRRFIDWQTFFDFGDGKSKQNKLIDTKLSSVLFDLIGQRAGEPQSLAQLNLLRNLALKVPSGQDVAKAMRLTPLARGDLDDLKPYGLDTRTPLWFYVLREAERQAGGKCLGQVGGNIVAEVMIGLLEGDPSSYLRQNPEWKPSLPAATQGDFRMTDLLKFANVVTAL